METAKKAVLDAINGWDPTGNALYYFNPDTATSKWIWTRPQIKKRSGNIFSNANRAEVESLCWLSIIIVLLTVGVVGTGYWGCEEHQEKNGINSGEKIATQRAS